MAIDQPSLIAHLADLQDVWQRALEEHGFGAAVVPAGASEMYFQDDQAPPFHPNAHFARWFPNDDCEHSVLLVRPGEKPKLYFHHSPGYWHLAPTLPDWATDAFETMILGDTDEVAKELARDLAACRHVALVGPAQNADLNLPLAAINPERLVAKLHFSRAAKTPFEIARMREATAIGVRGHVAARDAFYAGGSEFDIHMAYLAASTQQESKLPYPNIIALNEHAGVLHYQHYDRQPPTHRHSFLIDAGGRSAGYHSDITRTYSATPGDDFDALIEALDEKQQNLIAEVRPGLSYVDLHQRMHLEVGDLLARFGLIKCSAQSAFEREMTDTFFPHGLGHLLGLQTHDVGGQLANDSGDTAAPPERFPSLRYTRSIAEGHVFTVEPGLYFIPMLLEALAGSDAGRDVDWMKVDALRPCGGIRIEDNVLVTADGAENLTRPAFACA